MANKDDELIPQEEQHQATTTVKKRKSELAEIQVDLSAPEPPSKKARRLLKKGKKLPKKQSESGDENEEPAEDGKADGVADDKKKKKERSPYGVWIGNLPFSVTKADLRKWLVDNSGGVITEDLITRVHMPTNKPMAGSKRTFENKGFAYVDFATYEANTAAIALSETELNGRRLLIKDANNYEGRPKKEEPEAAVAKIPEGRSSTKIFVGNLAFNTTEDDLWAHFEKCGKIRWVKVATFEDSGKCKGYGWVMFEEPEAAQWAVKGFVKIRETVETVEDFMDGESKADGDGDTEMKDAKEDREEAGSEENAEDGDDETDSKPEKPKKKELKEPRTRIRKWWVNQLFGRNLKVELAEDDQTRYQKRFGKGAKKKQKQEVSKKSTKSDTNAASKEKGSKSKELKEKTTKQEPSYATDINVARLTGAVVAPQGKKVKFDD
ncbi:RNA-binding protein rnp24-like protein [Thermochaetoides thermophila DSM 1495]|uniref:RNA-binding protein rnp24-like protein n=1 Tax=Chaetomium thermophilum (strain DSM 1495 / CBS 144.50 / IMI 039719) TaxID=759272 RepID=G0SE82_CHATD|nr:RNA-binding protein rnp24-like protein [Thermochaetoides thermophila DSM 1495]EGS18259.1 RNA-binding protein rnp24-like protein [Thermochaetoides thermophila DSM 1495]